MNVDSDREIYDLGTSTNKKVKILMGWRWRKKNSGQLLNIIGSFYSVKALQTIIMERCESISYE